MLGHIVSRKGLAVDKAKIQVIQKDMRLPSSPNYHMRFEELSRARTLLPKILLERNTRERGKI